MSYKCLTANDTEIGQKVILTNPSPHYVIGAANPVIYSRYECCGTVNDISGSRIFVRWDNGTRNTYISNQLALASHREKILSSGGNIEPAIIRAEGGEYISIWLKRIP